MSWKKNGSTSTLRRRLGESGLHGRIAVKNPLLRKQNNVKWTKALKTGKKEQGNKVLWIDESKFEIFPSNRRVYLRRRTVERAAISCITPTLTHGGGSVMLWRAFANFKVRDLHQAKRKRIRSAITANCSITWSHQVRGLWLKDLYSCKIMTQNILVHSTRVILKERGIAHPSIDVLAGVISGLKSHWTNVGWTWVKSQS